MPPMAPMPPPAATLPPLATSPVALPPPAVIVGKGEAIAALNRAVESLVGSMQLLRATLSVEDPNPFGVKEGLPGPIEEKSTVGGFSTGPHVSGRKSYKEAVAGEGGQRKETGEGQHNQNGGKKFKIPFSKKKPTCFRCGSLGHYARECRDPERCFRCGRLGHRQWHCRAVVGPTVQQKAVAPPPSSSLSNPPPTQPIKEQPASNLISTDSNFGSRSEMEKFTKFNNTPASQELEAAFKRSVYLANPEGWGRERFLEALRQSADFSWRVSNFDEGYMLVEGPRWWREQALREGQVILEGKSISAEPWDQVPENGHRLKSVWLKVLGFPLKHWNRPEFERLVEKFGMLLEIDPATEAKTSFVAAKLRIGVCDKGDIPAVGRAMYRNDRGEWCWKPVRFVIENPGKGRISGVKRRRVWRRRSDPEDEAGEGEDPQREDELNEGEEEEEFDDLDLLEEERNNQPQEEGDKLVTSEVISQESQVSGRVSGISFSIEREELRGEMSEVEVESKREGEMIISKQKKGAGNQVPQPDQAQIKIMKKKGEEYEVQEELQPHIEAVEEGEQQAERAIEKGTDEISKEGSLQMVVFEENSPPVEAAPLQMVASRVTRQSLRQKLLEPAKLIQDKAITRAKEKNLEVTVKGKSNSLDKFPFNELSDIEVLDLFDCCGIILADSTEEKIENIKFLRSLSKQQFQSTIEEMELK